MLLHFIPIKSLLGIHRHLPSMVANSHVLPFVASSARKGHLPAARWLSRMLPLGNHSVAGHGGHDAVDLSLSAQSTAPRARHATCTAYRSPYDPHSLPAIASAGFLLIAPRQRTPSLTPDGLLPHGHPPKLPVPSTIADPSARFGEDSVKNIAR